MGKEIPLKFRGKNGFRGKRGLRERGGNLTFTEVWSGKFGSSRLFTDYLNWMKPITDIICPPPPISFSNWGTFNGTPMMSFPRLFDGGSR